MTTLVLIKIAVTMVAVLGLSFVAERISTRLAGILAGFPHGIAIVLFFIGVEQGVEFASRAALFSTAGLGANVVLAYTYARLAKGRGVIQALVAGVGAVLVFLVYATGAAYIGFGQSGALGMTLFSIIFVWLLIRRRNTAELGEKPTPRAVEILLRAALAAGIVILITGLAALIGPERAGLLAGFPVVTFPLLLIIHARHGPDPVARIVRHYPFGILSLVVFTLTVSWAFAAFGMGLGTLIGLFASLGYLLAASVTTTFFKRSVANRTRETG